jgi:hypothetical protein
MNLWDHGVRPDRCSALDLRGPGHGRVCGQGVWSRSAAGLLLGSASAPPLPMNRVIAQDLGIYGSHGMAAHEYAPMLALVADTTLRPELLVGEILPLEEAGTAAGRDGPAGDRSRDDCDQPSRVASKPVCRRQHFQRWPRVILGLAQTCRCDA